MLELPESPESLWRASPQEGRPPLTESIEVDVAVIGAGITGMATAALAAQAGCRVAVLEDRSVGAGATGFSTAKVSVLHGARYSTLVDKHGPEVATRYANAQKLGLEWLRENSPGFEDEQATTYATDASTRRTIEEEAAACQVAGIDARVVDHVDAPFPTSGAVVVDGQGQIDPTPLLQALADDVE